MNTRPKVGIVIPSFERLLYLKEAVESALSQTYENIEIFINDDYSPDPAIKEYLSSISDPRLRWAVNETNIGTTRNYDLAVRKLSHDVEWCIILDNDDYLDRDFIKEAVQLSWQHPHVKVIHGRQVYINEKKQEMARDNGFPLLETAEDYIQLRGLGKRDIRSSSVFFNVEKFKEAGGYPLFLSGMGTDMVLIFALAFDNMLAYARKSSIYIRIHDEAESITTNNLFEKLSSLRQMHEYCGNIYKRYPLPEQKNRKKVFRQIKRCDRELSSALLVKKFREVIETEMKDSAKNILKEIKSTCKEKNLSVSLKFSILANIFIAIGVNLEETFVHKVLRRTKRYIFPLGRFLKNIKRALKRIPVILYVYRQLRIFPPLSKGSISLTGWRYCTCCGWWGLFFWDKDYARSLGNLVPLWGFGEKYAQKMIIRENDNCAYCGSVTRLRAHAQDLLKTLNQKNISGFVHFLKNNQDFIVYEAANYRLFRTGKLRELKNYIVSEYHPDYPFGEEVLGIRNESLEELTFSDESIDIVITSEVLEHVADLSKALKEIHRVLKKGGCHIFTIPVDHQLEKTRVRAVVQGGEIKHLLPQAMHGDDISDGALAFRDFGSDVKAIIKEYGFTCEEKQHLTNGELIVSVYVSRKN